MLPPPSRNDWRRLEPLIDAMLDADPDRRAMLMAEFSAGDAARHEELAHLVAECERPYPLIETSVADRFDAVFGDEAPALPELLAGRYRMLGEVGRGGMAIVYIARDLKHGRDVAVKVVRRDLAAALGRARFLREIEIAAQLRHPNIVPLYDSGEVRAEPPNGDQTDVGPSLLYYVMPYEAGHSLRERLTRDGPFSVQDAVLILKDVCEALSYAHQHGIVHRDIKPDNVLLSGRHAMVSDFGVARAVTEATTEPTLAVQDMAFGTAPYMAPEQATNDPDLDHRADIYAVGVLAYELLAGQPPFPDEAHGPIAERHPTHTLLPLTSFRSDVPDALAEVIRKCLATQPADRWQSADELLVRLGAIPHPIGATAPAAIDASRVAATGPTRGTPALIGVATGAALVVTLLVTRAPSRDEPAILLLGQHTRLTSDPGLEVQPSISPDGQCVAYAAGHSLQMRIVIRPVAGGKALTLTADTTSNAWMPRWSPDGTRILFLSRGGVFSVPAVGGNVRQEISSRPGAIVTSAVWSPDGREIVYVRADSLLARSVGSGGVRLITTGRDLHSCSWSPNGDRLACVAGNSFYVTVGAIFGLGPMFGNLAPSRIVLIPAAGGAPVTVTDSGSLHQSPVWSRDGRTLYYVSNQQGPRDIYALGVGERGSERKEPMRVTTGLNAHSIGFSSDGARIVYAAYTSSANVWAMPIPRKAPASSAAVVQVTSGNQTVEGVRVSFDGQWLVYDSDLSGNSDVYRVPVSGGEPERLTRGSLDEFRGALSPDGTELTYHSFLTGSRNMFLLPLNGGPEEQITRSLGHLSMANWSPDGTALTLFDMTNDNVLVMRRDDRERWGAPRFVGGRGWRPEWSPDGRTIAFVSATDGRIGMVPADSGAQRDLYVPGTGDPLAELAIYSANGRELYFKSHDANGRASFWSIPVVGGRPRLLARFDDPARASNRFEFASDGKRFYFTIEDRQSDIWMAEVAGLAARRRNGLIR